MEALLSIALIIAVCALCWWLSININVPPIVPRELDPPPVKAASKPVKGKSR
jgi:hypothetical protein